MNKIIKNIICLFDPLAIVKNPIKLRIEREDLHWVQIAALINYIAWPLIFITLFFLVDQQKQPLSIWATYRFGSAFVIIMLGVFAFIFRSRRFIISLSLYFVALFISLTVSWSMSFTQGYVVQSKWVIINASIILITASRSFFLPAAWLIFIVMISSLFWKNYSDVRPLITDTVVSIFVIFFAHFVKRIWIQSKVNQFLHDDAIQKNLDLQLQLHSEVKKFVPPVLVQRIEEQTRNDKPIAIAVDDILMRRKNDVAVLFSDIRNFSERSTDMEFVEKELIPSSIKLIDMVEANKGIAKQIGDAIFVYYSTEGPHPDAPKEALLRAFKDATIGCLVEKQRVKDLGRDKSERFFSIAYGPALIGNMASSRHREATVIGAPANLAARMDSLTKEPVFKPLVEDGRKILVCDKAKKIMDEFEGSLVFEKIELEAIGITIKSFPDEKIIYLFHITKENINALNEILVVNDIDPIDIENYV